MAVVLQGATLPLGVKEVNELWEVVRRERSYYVAAEVVVQGVDEAEMTRLNTEYRQKPTPTNVLTFTYPANPDLPNTEQVVQHDIAVCVAIGRGEAMAYNLPWRDYAALLLVHAFLHATGLDHELSPKDAAAMQDAERRILTSLGFASHSLGDHL